MQSEKRIKEEKPAKKTTRKTTLILQRKKIRLNYKKLVAKLKS